MMSRAGSDECCGQRFDPRQLRLRPISKIQAVALVSARAGDDTARSEQEEERNSHQDRSTHRQ